MSHGFSFPNYGLFNATYYLQQNPDVATSWTGTPLQHYQQFGALEGRAPTAWFNADFYRASYTDLQSMNALQLFNHYCNNGFNEGRVPMLNFSNFNGARYLLDNPDVAAAGYTAGNAISHFVAYGEYEGRAAYAQNGVVINPVVNEGDVFTLTTGIDNIDGTQFNDSFDASLGAVGVTASNTLQSFDSLDGMGGTDTLNAVLMANATPANLANIEIVQVAAVTNAATLGLLNAGQVTNVNNNGSTEALTVTGIAAGADLSVSNVDVDATTFTYASTAGVQSVELAVDNVTNAADIVIAGVETITTSANGNDSSIDLVATSATTLNFAGAADLVVGDLGVATTRSVSLIDASDMTGGLTLTTGTQTGVLNTTDVSIFGGMGNDTFTVSGLAQDYTATLGEGDDTVVDINITVNDSIAGGLGRDTLSTTAARAAVLSATTPTTFNITGMDVLTLSDAMAGQTIHTHNIDTTIDTVNAAGGNGTVMFNAGSNIVNLTAALAGGTFLVDVDGSATTDSVSINNTATAGAIFGGQNITTTGFETVTINTGSYATAAAQTVGAVNVGANALVITGSNSFVSDTGDAITASSINASGLTGTAVLTQTVAAVGTTSITGSSNADTLIGAATATTIFAGAGNDTATGGVAADSIDGGAGNDSLVGAGGNDTIHGGEGNDTIVATVAGTVSITGGAGDDLVNMGATLNTGDVIDGGAGTNTLEVDQQIIAAYAGATNFSTLRLDGNARVQNVSLYTNLNLNVVELTDTLTLHDSNVTGLADGTLVKIRSDADHALSLLTDTATNTLSIGAYGAGGRAFGSVIVDNTNTLNIVQADQDTLHGTEVGLLDSDQISQINITGHQLWTSVNQVNFGATARGITVDATAVDGDGDPGIGDFTVYFDATNAVAGQNLTMLGSLTKNSVLIGGADNDVITGGTASDSLVGGAGNDSISGGSGNDTITGGRGDDALDVGTGTDQTIYSGALAETQQGIAATGFTFTGDTITSLGNGDSISLAGVSNLALANGAIAVGTTFATSTANTALLVSGSYNTLTGIFTAGAASAINNDYLLQFSGATASTHINNVMLVDIVGTVTAASLAEIITLTVA